MSNGDKVNFKVVVFDEIYSFVVNNCYLRSFGVSNIEYKIQNYVVKRIVSAV